MARAKALVPGNTPLTGVELPESGCRRESTQAQTPVHVSGAAGPSPCCEVLEVRLELGGTQSALGVYVRRERGPRPRDACAEGAKDDVLRHDAVGDELAEVVVEPRHEEQPVVKVVGETREAVSRVVVSAQAVAGVSLRLDKLPVPGLPEQVEDDRHVVGPFRGLDLPPREPSADAERGERKSQRHDVERERGVDAREASATRAGR